jgi:hypothetical protein
MGERSDAYRILVGKPERKSPLARPIRDRGIIWIFKKWNGVWTGLIWLSIWTLLNAAMNLRGP